MQIIFVCNNNSGSKIFDKPIETNSTYQQNKGQY